MAQERCNVSFLSAAGFVLESAALGPLESTSRRRSVACADD